MWQVNLAGTGEDTDHELAVAERLQQAFHNIVQEMRDQGMNPTTGDATFEVAGGQGLFTLREALAGEKGRVRRVDPDLPNNMDRQAEVLSGSGRRSRFDPNADERDVRNSSPDPVDAVDPHDGDDHNVANVREGIDPINDPEELTVGDSPDIDVDANDGKIGTDEEIGDPDEIGGEEKIGD